MQLAIIHNVLYMWDKAHTMIDAEAMIPKTYYDLSRFILQISKIKADSQQYKNYKL